MCQKSTLSQSLREDNQTLNILKKKIPSSIYSIGGFTLTALATVFLLPLTQARHIHDNPSVALNDEHRASGSSSFISSDNLPAWHVNPFYGLKQSSSESNSDSDASIDIDCESSYEEIPRAAVQAAMREFQRQRMRHRRSHLLRFFARSKLEEEAAPSEWKNPCGGVYIPKGSQPIDSESSSHGRLIKRKYLISLRNNTMREFEYMRNTAKLNYGSGELWQHEYKFLPNMTRPTSAIKLKTWYRHMQIFVGSFAYLGKSHYKYRKQQQLSLDESTHELHDLLVSARRMLCDIETTINSSYPNSNGAKLVQVSKSEMSDRLKFYTPADGSKETDIRDLKFSKLMYYQYLDNMWKTLRRSLRKQSRISQERKNQQHHIVDATAGTLPGVSVSSLQSLSLESSSDSRTARQHAPCLNSPEC